MQGAEGEPIGSAPVHAFADDALGDHDAVGLVGELAAGRVSAAELTDAAIARTAVVDRRLHAVAAERFDRARVEAAGGVAGWFAGLPTFVKDNCDVAGLPTQEGTDSYSGHPKPSDGDLAAHLRSLGLVVLGKTRLSEFGFSASAEPVDGEPVRNPWSPEHTAGASSAGAAVLVATGAVPLAHGNDGGGSIRIPASCCGLVGLKPTRGRVPQDRTFRRLPVRIVSDGVLTRSVRDCAAFLRESERADRHALRLPPVGDVVRPGHRRLRVALITESIRRATDPQNVRETERVAELLESLGHHVEPATVPVGPGFEDDFLLYWGLLALVRTSTGRRSLDPSFDKSRTDNLTRGLAASARRAAWRLPAAITRLRRTAQRSRAFYARYDVALTPTLGHPTPRLGQLSPAHPYSTIVQRLVDWVTYTPLHNASGTPAISLPLGRDDDGLPLGVMLSAGHGHERRLLELAYELEQARPFARIQAGLAT